MRRPERELGLSNRQFEQIRKLRTESKDDMMALRQKVHSLSEQRKTALQSGDQFDTTKLATLDEELVKAAADLMRARLRMQREVFAILTPEQRKRFAESHRDRPGQDRGRDFPGRRPNRFQDR